jgi:ABC-type transport system involved in multi-copper enzyme maturation permease subunit
VKILALALAVVFFIIAVLYLIGILQVGASHPGPHVSHGILFLVLGILSLVWVRFQSNASTPKVR